MPPSSNSLAVCVIQVPDEEAPKKYAEALIAHEEGSVAHSLVSKWGCLPVATMSHIRLTIASAGGTVEAGPLASWRSLKAGRTVYSIIHMLENTTKAVRIP